MAKQSGMIAFAEQFAQAKVDAAQRLTSQYMIDTLQMTIHQTEGWGYERIMRLTEAWQQTQMGLEITAPPRLQAVASNGTLRTAQTLPS